MTHCNSNFLPFLFACTVSIHSLAKYLYKTRRDSMLWYELPRDARTLVLHCLTVQEFKGSSKHQKRRWLSL